MDCGETDRPLRSRSHSPSVPPRLADPHLLSRGVCRAKEGSCLYPPLIWQVAVVLLLPVFWRRRPTLSGVIFLASRSATDFPGVPLSITSLMNSSSMPWSRGPPGERADGNSGAPGGGRWCHRVGRDRWAASSWGFPGVVHLPLLPPWIEEPEETSFSRSLSGTSAPIHSGIRVVVGCARAD